MIEFQERIEHLIARYDEETSFNLWRSRLAYAREIAWLNELMDKADDRCV
jgi:hypothetical protein